MDISNFDVSVVYVREDGSYVINKGMYHVPNMGEWVDLWQQVSDYVAANPDVVQEEPDSSTIEPTAEEIANQLLTATTFELIKHTYPYTTEQYKVLVEGNMYEEFDENKEYPEGWIVLYEGNLYKLSTSSSVSLSFGTIQVGNYTLTLVCTL